MRRRASAARLAPLAALALSGAIARDPVAPVRGVLVEPSQATAQRLQTWSRAGFRSVALVLDDGAASAARAACARIRAAGLEVDYWIEIGRDPRLAELHPEWMASLQGHSEWRRHFPGFPEPQAGEVVKNYPWVPVLYREAFEAHLGRVRALLDQLPDPRAVFLNDLQGAPSACGCGNVLCRWTADYGPIRTATPLGPDAAARFVAAVARLRPRSEVVAVWTPECEQHDRTDACAGVGCFEGSCWRELAAQLRPIAEREGRIGVLVPYRALGRELARYGSDAGWVRFAVAELAEMPARRGAAAIERSRMIAVLQGWDTSNERAQIEQARQAGAGGYLVALSAIDQRWEPRIVRLQR
jgi:hypothetical protein